MTWRHGVGITLAATALIACEQGDINGVPQCDTPRFIGASLRDNQYNGLSFFADVKVSEADSVKVQYGVTSLDSITPAFAVTSDSSTAFVLGLLPSTRYSGAIIAYNHCGSATSNALAINTKPLPPDLPSYSASGSEPGSGYVVFAAGNYGLVINNSGRVVWYRHFPSGPGLNFQAQPNGRFAARPNGEPGFIEVSPTGEMTRALTCARGLSPRMHDLIALSDGSYWLLCDESRIVDLSSQGAGSVRVTAQTVQHVDPNGALLFEWSPFSSINIDLGILRTEDFTASGINWTHGNAIDLDTEGNVLVSYRNLNELIKIDVHTGQILWRLGGEKSDFAFDDMSSPPFARQHGARTIGTTGVLLLDNLGEPSFSRAERYSLNLVTHRAQLVQQCGYNAGLVAQIGGSAQSLSDSHTLVSFGNGAGVEEYDSTGKVVWKLDGSPGYVFRAQRIHSLYFPGAGDPR
ncbi:MAG TPA: arylsulfotransferase family protein [Gemmatimonadaceae bacterium]